MTQGVTANHLNSVSDAIILSLITYGFLPFKLIGHMDAFIRRMFKYGFCNRLIIFRHISSNCDNTLFKLMLNSHSCIHPLLPSEKNEIMQLRPRGHKFTLSNCISKLR